MLPQYSKSGTWTFYVAEINDAAGNSGQVSGPELIAAGFPASFSVDVVEHDSDGDGTLDCSDTCRLDPLKVVAGQCGCGNPDTDTDGDGVANCIDGCSSDSNKTAPGQCGCGASDLDTDGDGTADCFDQCPDFAGKVLPGVCGCGVEDTDTDKDRTADCQDGCPNDLGKIAPGQCGCGISDLDTDGDGTADCFDQCPDFAGKVLPGVCGCGAEDTDTDKDRTADCQDGCPNDLGKIAPGQCGCFVPDTDSDGNGVADCISANLHSDGDEVSDLQEQVDGTNPNDRGSVLSVLSTTLCSEWNGFLGGMWNIMEHVNMSNTAVNVQSTLYSINGEPEGITNFSIPAGAQFDLLAHDMPGWKLDSYGKICSTVNSGNAGDLDGRMVYYKALDTGGNAYDFAFAMPFLNGTSGKQFVPFNTFQPSLDPDDSQNLVANWIQLTNLETSTQQGTLRFYGQNGVELGVPVRVSLLPGARQDFSGHQFGPNLVGIIGWQADNTAAKFQLRNVRYFYDNAASQNSFDTAFQLEGLVGTGELIAVPLDTSLASAIIEVANVATIAQDITIDVYRSDGTLLESFGLNLPPLGSSHLITDSILNGQKGIATIKGSLANGVVAVAMQYGRTPSVGIKYVYGIPARQALGSTLRSSYNTFLNQACRLLLVNPLSAAQKATIRMIRYDATQVLSDEPVVVPGHGLIDYDLCGNESPKNYGVVTVETGTPNSLFSNVVRIGNNNNYRFPTPTRQ
jgi:hypothetical protein